MPFPTKLPKKVKDAGRLVAEFVYSYHDGSARFCFIVNCFSGGHRSFFYIRNKHSKRLITAAFTKGWTYNIKQLEIRLWESLGFIEEFVARLLREVPQHLIHIDRIGHGMPSASVPESVPEPSQPPRRPILSRNDWMKIHYPGHVPAQANA